MENNKKKYSKIIYEIAKEVKKISGIEAMLKEMSPIINDLATKTNHIIERFKDFYNKNGKSKYGYDGHANYKDLFYH